MRGFGMVVTLALSHALTGEGLRHGEHVHTTKRSQFNEMRTEWTPLLREFQPRFSEDSEIELPSIKPNLLPDNSELKMSFAFDHDHYVTEWISIANGNGKFLNSLRFFLTYSGDHITDVSWKLEYNDEPVHHSQWPKTLWVEYTWIPAPELDEETGLNVLFLGGFVVSMAAVVCTVTNSASLIENEGNIVLVEPEKREDRGSSKPSSDRGRHRSGGGERGYHLD